MSASKSTALVLFSGGQDSTTCLAWALQNYNAVDTVGFDYGQGHLIELECRENILEKMNPEGDDHLLKLPILNELSETSLTRDMEIKMQDNGLPNTFVPARNIMFLTVAAMLAYRKGIKDLITGVCETDYSGYPDCRDQFVQSMAQSLTYGMGTDMAIHTPLMFIDKAQTWALADEIGGPELIKIMIEDTHTCYQGDRSQLHSWGYGCGTCPACDLRKSGFEKWQNPKAL